MPDPPGLIQKALKGVIKAKTEQELTIGQLEPQEEFKVTLTKAVLVTNGERPATIADLVVGQMVQVTLKKGTHEAASIAILSDEPRPLAEGR